MNGENIVIKDKMSSTHEQEVQLQALRTVNLRFRSLSKKFSTVADQLAHCEKNLQQLVSAGKLFNLKVFQRIAEEATNRVSPIEMLSQSITGFIDNMISTSVMMFNSDRKIALLEDKVALVKKATSRDSTMTSEMSCELGQPQSPTKQRLNYEDGYYVGESADGQRHGYGCFYHNSGNYCEGNFVNDKCNGYGEFFFSDGTIYKGQFKDNRLEGRGVVYFSNGDIYEGEFFNEQRHGQGIFYYKDDTRFNGHFVKGRKHGLGVRFYSNGERYEGNYSDDRREGKGTYYHKDGSKELRVYEKGSLKYSEKISG